MIVDGDEALEADQDPPGGTVRAMLLAPFRWIGRHPFVVTLALIAAGNVAGFTVMANNQADDRARDCVAAHRIVDRVRDAIPIPSEALIATFPDADPATVVRLREQTRRLIEATLTEPRCDLTAAEHELDT
jgi:hypothetical protein